MKTTQLTTAMTMVALATASTASFANTGDEVFTSLTGKKVFAEVSHPVSLYDYAEGNSSYEEAYLNGRLNADANPNPAAVKDNDGNITGYAEQQESFDLNLDANYKNVISKIDSNLSYGAKAGVEVKRGNLKGADTQDNWGAEANLNYDKYFTEDLKGAFWYGKGQVAFQQANGDNGGFSNPQVDVTGGVGYGRVVNVTPMARAIRIVEALVERKILKTTPSVSVYSKIATIASKEAEYKSKYGADYAQKWVEDITNVLGADIGGAGTIKLYEVLTQEKISTRKHGWDVRAGLGAQLASFSGVSDDIKPLLEAQANYYYPLDLKTQFSNEASLSTTIDDDNGSYNFKNAMGLTYQLSDRVDWTNTWNLDYQNNDNAENVTTNELTSSYIYKVSNALDFDATFKVSHTDDGIDGNDNGKVDKGLTTGLKYRLK